MARSTVPQVPDHVRMRIHGLITSIEVLLEILPGQPLDGHPQIISKILEFSNLLKQEYFLLTGHHVAW